MQLPFRASPRHGQRVADMPSSVYATCMVTRRNRRIVAYFLLTFAGLAPFVSVAGYGIYLRSSLHRGAVERRLTRFFGLPTRIGRLIPLSWQEFELHDVEMSLINGDGHFDPELRIASCRKALWVRNEQTGRFNLLILGAQLDLTPAQWKRGDFQRLAQSLRHDYPALELDHVAIRQGQVRWASGQFAIEIDDAEGAITFDLTGPGPVGVARLSAGKLNGQPASLSIDARLNARGDLAEAQTFNLVREFTLSTNPQQFGTIPLGQLGLGRLLGTPAASGQFGGTLEYRLLENGHAHLFTLRDTQLRRVQLAEFSPLAGELDLDIQRLDFAYAGGDLRFDRAVFAGTVRDFDLAAAMRLAELPSCRGTIHIQVQCADVQAGVPIREFQVAGRARGLDLGELTSLANERFNGGRLHGQAAVPWFNARISDGQISAAEAAIFGDRTGRQTVDLRLIESLAPVIAQIQALVKVLPDSVAYRSLRVQVSSDGNAGLILQGRGGDDDKSMLTLLIPTPRLAQLLGEHIAYNVAAPAEPVDISQLTLLLAQPIPPVTLSQVLQVLEAPPRPDPSGDLN